MRPKQIPVLIVCAILAVFLSHTGFAAPDRRVALVIGNSAYQFSPLANPVNDANDMSAALKQLGFDVIHMTNADQRSIETAIHDFGNRIKKGGTGLFYFAGHGVQVNGRNYLVPVGAEINKEFDVKYEAVDVGRVLDSMFDAGNGVNIVILDACRDNPFARSFRSASRGLARMDAPTGTFIAYATAPGSTAMDGEGRNGVFTKHLLDNMREVGLEIEHVLKQTRVGVMDETANLQVPWQSSSLTGRFYFKPEVQTAAVQPATSQEQTRGDEMRRQETLFWESIKDSTDPGIFEAYLAQFPKGTFVPVAKYKINQLKQSAAKQKAEPPPQPKADPPPQPKVEATPPPKATLAIDSNIKGAEVLLDSKPIGTTPLSNYTVEPGTHKVQVQKSGYQTYKKTHRLAADQTQNIYASLIQDTPTLPTKKAQTNINKKVVPSKKRKSTVSKTPSNNRPLKVAILPWQPVTSDFFNVILDIVVARIDKSPDLNLAISYYNLYKRPEVERPDKKLFSSKTLKTIWKRKGFLSDPAPDIEKIASIGRKLNVDRVFIGSYKLTEQGVSTFMDNVKFYMIDVHNDSVKRYEDKSRADLYMGNHDVISKLIAKAVPIRN